jgi:hypothetical protein
MMRVPYFCFADLSTALAFASWLREVASEIHRIATQVSRHARLMSVEPQVLGQGVHLHLIYESGDAAGQNMTTACTWHACQWILEAAAAAGHRPEAFYVEGNMSSDKKVSFQSFVQGRGTRVVAECFVAQEHLQRVLKVSPQRVHQGVLDLRDAAAAVGTVGGNACVSNVLAGIFTATGQDIACVHESSVALLQSRLVDGGVRLHLSLPSLVVGTVGGGTHLPRQAELLEMMGCRGDGGLPALAEIIAGFCLTLELSTTSACVGGQFALAHERLGRNRPVEWLTPEEVTPGFLEGILRRTLGDEELRVTTAGPAPEVSLGDSILTELSSRKVRRMVGIFPYRLSCVSPSRGEERLEAVLKIKPLDEEVLLMAGALAGLGGSRLGRAFSQHREHLGFRGCHLRELALYAQSDPRFRRHVPEVYGVHQDKEREIYLLLLERLLDGELLDSAADPGGWTPEHLERALEGLGELHALWYRREEELLSQEWLGSPPSARGMIESAPLWAAMAEHAAQELEDELGGELLDLHLSRVETVERWWREIESLPRTLIHGDLNPRNVAFRRGPDGPTLFAYDWELATLHLPQRDLVELLAFILPSSVELPEVRRYSEVHRRALERHSGYAIDADEWWWGADLALRDFRIHRFAQYCVAHSERQYRFLTRVHGTLRRMEELMETSAPRGQGGLE